MNSSKTTGRTVKLGVVHAVLNRLEEKGWFKANWAEATNVQGGKRKKILYAHHSGKAALVRICREMRDQLWNRVPEFARSSWTEYEIEDSKTQLPPAGTHLLTCYCKPELLEDLQGDLYEYFERNVKSKRRLGVLDSFTS